MPRGPRRGRCARAHARLTGEVCDLAMGCPAVPDREPQLAAARFASHRSPVARRGGDGGEGRTDGPAERRGVAPSGAGRQQERALDREQELPRVREVVLIAARRACGRAVADDVAAACRIEGGGASLKRRGELRAGGWPRRAGLVEDLQERRAEVGGELVVPIVSARPEQRREGRVLAGDDHGAVEPLDRRVVQRGTQFAQQFRLGLLVELVGDPEAIERRPTCGDCAAQRLETLARTALDRSERLALRDVLRVEPAGSVPRRDDRRRPVVREQEAFEPLAVQFAAQLEDARRPPPAGLRVTLARHEPQHAERLQVAGERAARTTVERDVRHGRSPSSRRCAATLRGRRAGAVPPGLARRRRRRSRRTARRRAPYTRDPARPDRARRSGS